MLEARQRWEGLEDAPAGVRSVERKKSRGQWGAPGTWRQRGRAQQIIKLESAAKTGRGELDGWRSEEGDNR